MKRKLFTGIAIAALSLSMMILTTSFANAMPVPYVTGNLGITFLPTIDYQIPTQGSLKLSSKTGFDAGMAFGAQLDNNWRVEGAFDYLHNRAKNITAPSGSIISGIENDTGATKATTYMLNGYYDFYNCRWSFVPYLGAGVGVANVVHGLKFTGGGSTTEINLGAISFAYQGAVGASVRLTDQVKVNLDYRYLQTTKNTLIAISGVEVSARHYAANRVTLGLTANI